LGVAAVITMATMLALAPQQKAALVVVSGLPAPPGVAGVIVQNYDRDAPRPFGALVVADQEGGKVRTFPQLPPRTSARAVRSKADAFASGVETGRALRRTGVNAVLGPVLGADAARAIRILVPLARSGELDVRVARVLLSRPAID
jgi:beta-glucosidase-like glycosyl hydrolase